jgi:hypothetical protein
MKIQQTCTCGAKFIGNSEQFDTESQRQSIQDKYEAFNRRHCHCHESLLPEKITNRQYPVELKSSTP